MLKEIKTTLQKEPLKRNGRSLSEQQTAVNR